MNMSRHKYYDKKEGRKVGREEGWYVSKFPTF